jgi:hypothetical protein
MRHAILRDNLNEKLLNSMKLKYFQQGKINKYYKIRFKNHS